MTWPPLFTREIEVEPTDGPALSVRARVEYIPPYTDRWGGPTDPELVEVVLLEALDEHDCDVLSDLSEPDRNRIRAAAEAAAQTFVNESEGVHVDDFVE